MPTTGNRQILTVPRGLCPACVRALSRRLRDLPGMVWFEIDGSAGVVRFDGRVDLTVVAAVVAAVSCSRPRPDVPEP